MKISIWDIKASREDGMIMHFDIIVPINVTNKKVVNAYANDFLKTKLFGNSEMTSSKCSFCQIESSLPQLVGQIHSTGYYVDSFNI